MTGNDQPFFASAPGAEGWLQANPGGHVFSIAEMFERPWYADIRDSLQPLLHPVTGPSASRSGRWLAGADLLVPARG